MLSSLLELYLKRVGILFLFLPFFLKAQNRPAESLRPQIHFTPQKGWMNDPNGMVYYKGWYHLFFQHNPNSTVWGPMHWGHAVSKDLIHWEEQKIALYPDRLGTIFSGSAVIDKENAAGFGKNAMIAIYTSHNHILEQEGVDTFQTQSIAYSLDEGETWIKYKNNPVLRNPGNRDFRDPKVFWFTPERKWVMSLAVRDHIEFYASSDLKSWKKTGEFGKSVGAHGGVWECPDLVSFELEEKQVWVLIVNLNPGGPNGGSASQYFTGEFDGSTFKPFDEQVRWLDYGPDEYAGVTWNNTGDRNIFLGWMSNWRYANVVPTKKWRSSMTIARELSLGKIAGQYFVKSQPVAALDRTMLLSYKATNVPGKSFNVTSKAGKLSGALKLDLSLSAALDFSITLSNGLAEKTIIGFDAAADRYFIDRTQSGMVSFDKGFAGRFTAPRFTDNPQIKLTLVIDRTSVELFADDGLTTMTCIFFPKKNYDDIAIQSSQGQVIRNISVWRPKEK